MLLKNFAGRFYYLYNYQNLKKLCLITKTNKNNNNVFLKTDSLYLLQSKK